MNGTKKLVNMAALFFIIGSASLTLVNCTSEETVEILPPGVFDTLKIDPIEAENFARLCPELQSHQNIDAFMPLLYHKVYFSKYTCEDDLSQSCGAFVVNVSSGKCVGPVDLLDSPAPFQYESPDYGPQMRSGKLSELPILFKSREGEVFLLEWPMSFKIVNILD